jgi:hypothetical protein
MPWMKVGQEHRFDCCGQTSMQENGKTQKKKKTMPTLDPTFLLKGAKSYKTKSNKSITYHP